MVFLAPLRGSKKGVLRGPSWTKRCCSCSSPWSSVVLRGPSWPSVSFVVLRGPPCPSWTKEVAVAVLRGPSRSFVDKKALQLQFSVVLRGPPCPSWTKRCCSCSSPWSSVALRVLRGQKGVAVAVLRGPPWPSVSFVDKRSCRCSSSRPFVVLRGPSWTKKVL